MPYNLAVSAAELDAEMLPGAVIEQDVDQQRIVIKVAGQVVGAYPYKD